MKPILFMTKGLPASGKSAFAKEQVACSKGRTKRVSRDDLRLMVDPKWSQDKEKAVIAARNGLVNTWLALGYNVIVDETSLSPSVEAQLRPIAAKYSADFREVSFLDVSVEDCIKRDLGRPGAVGQNVILEMYYKYLCAPAPKWDSVLPKCLICDIDGTLAKTTGRGPFEENRVSEDVVRPFVRDAVKGAAAHHGCSIIIFSGRQDSCREATAQWLFDNGIYANSLFMRPAGDRRPDYVVKTEMYKENIEGKFNVVGIWDDRMQVIRSCWEKLGLGDRLFRCGETMREF